MPSRLSEPSESRLVFVQQSSWLIFASVTGGALTWGVHFLAKRVPEGDYGVYVTALALLSLIPVVPLQMLFVQQTALALASGATAQLATLVRRAWGATTVVWLVTAGGVLSLRETIIRNWQLPSGSILIPTLSMLLMALWAPIFMGLLQGSQRFWWLGWSQMINSVGRIVGAGLLVVLLAAGAWGMLTGVVAGLAFAIVVAAWQTRDLWTAPGAPCDWRQLTKQCLPLIIGFSAFQFLITGDTIFVKRQFSPEETDFYGAAGTLCRALVWVVGPLVTVMFPKVVRSRSREGSANLLKFTLLGTALLVGVGGVVLVIVGPWAIRFVYLSRYVEVAVGLLPWFAMAMAPMAVAKVVVYHLLARSDTRIVPWLVALAVAFGIVLSQVHGSLITVIQIMGGFALATCVAGAIFRHRPGGEA